MFVAKAEPPVEALYHCKLDPVADKLLTVGESEEQKDWAEAVGAAGVAPFSTRTISSKLIR